MISSSLPRITQESITFSWSAGSSLTAFYVIYAQRISGNRRDAVVIPSNGTWSEPLQNSTATSYAATNLISGAFYQFRVRAYAADAVSYNDVTYTYQTTATADQVLPPGVIGVQAGVVAGVAIAVVLLFMVLIVGFFLYKRNMQMKQKKLLEEYSSQLQMLTLNRGGVLPNSFMAGGTADIDALRANLVVPKTHFTGADATLLNTVMEVALPGFLFMDYSTDLRPEARLTAGGAGTIFRGALLQPDAIQRNGTEVCAIKEVSDWPSLSEDDNLERFHQEVSIMWSLSFHPNVIKLVGYTENPNTIVTRLYPTDLFRYLHTQEDKSPLESHLLLHMCSGMVAALAAVHSMGIAHRDIKTPNFLLQEPRAGSPFPDPILCDFGLSRTSDESGRFDAIKGFSPRYAAPEVFARVHLRSASNNLEDDKASDVYSLGVVLWETTARVIPWDGVTNDDIELHIRGGARVPELEVDSQDGILLLVNSMIDASLHPSPERRPTMATINGKFANFIRDILANGK